MKQYVRAFLVMVIAFLTIGVMNDANASRKKPATVRVLTSKQVDIKEAYDECIAKSTLSDPVNGVIEFVFDEQDKREQSFFRSAWKAFRGSGEHHGQEVCFVRAFDLKGFQSQSDINRAKGRLLFEPRSPYLEIPYGLVPSDRRLVRPWVSKYLSELASTLRATAIVDGIPENNLKNLRVTDMVRSYANQNSLVRRGYSPADCRYEFLCSSHTSGSSVDLGIKFLSRIERERLENQLKVDQKARKIFFIIENNHFHVFVLPPKYIGE